MFQLKYLPHRLINKLYSNNFLVYRPLYFLYKKISDHSKIKLIQSNIKSGMTVLDIGANIGFYTLQLSQLVGSSGQVHAFEPDPQNFKYLHQTTRNISNIRLNKIAISNNCQPVRLYFSDQLNVDHQTYDIGQNRPSTSVNAINLDHYLQSQSIDFIKIDIQGYEHQALLGAKKVLTSNHPLTILSEFYPFGLIKTGSSPEKYINFLRCLGFKIKFLSTKNKKFLYQKQPDPNFYCDFIATKS